MAMWTSNQLNITGPKEDVDRFQELAGKKYPTKKWIFHEDGSHEWEDDVSEKEFSFWNFIGPDEKIINEYFGDEPRVSFAEAIKFESNHWYDWNVRNWGTKWDAAHVFVERKSDTELVCTFETANGTSEPVFMEMVRLFPELSFDYRFVGEEGWGGEYHGDGGIYWIVSEWNEPTTHEDRMENIGYCHCEEVGTRQEDIEYLYDDCPPKMALTASKK